MKRIALAAAALLLASSAATASASPPGGSRPVTADLDGRPIPASEVSRHYCHDREFPRIHCYATPSALEAALGAPGGGGVQPASASDYVVIYSGTIYSGNYMYLSQNYDVLALIGWNDRIRSYRALNGASGVFYTDWFGQGLALAFCCNQAVTYLSPAFDDQISSVYRT